jgi:hypothetical protein
MSSLEYTDVTLPSRGQLYGGILPGGVVPIRKLTVGEEIILQSSVSGHALVSKLLSACCKFPAGFNHESLLVTDRVALLLALRTHSFGPKYVFTYRCTSCGARGQHACDTRTDLQAKVADDNNPLVEPLEVKLEDSASVVAVRYLRGKDENALAANARQRAESGKDEEDDDGGVVGRLAAHIISVDGKEMGVLDKERFVRSLTSNDAHLIRYAIQDSETGVSLSLETTCKKCKSINDLVLPFHGDFFRPARRKD